MVESRTSQFRLHDQSHTRKTGTKKSGCNIRRSSRAVQQSSTPYTHTPYLPPSFPLFMLDPGRKKTHTTTTTTTTRGNQVTPQANTAAAPSKNPHTQPRDASARAADTLLVSFFFRPEGFFLGAAAAASSCCESTVVPRLLLVMYPLCSVYS